MGLFPFFQKERTEKHQDVQQEQEKEFKLIGSQLLKPGQKFFQFNVKTKEFKECYIERSKDIDFSTLEHTKNHRIVTEKDCVYVIALNSKNAKRKIRKHLGIPKNAHYEQL